MAWRQHPHASLPPRRCLSYRSAGGLGVDHLPRAVHPPEEVRGVTSVMDVPAIGGGQLYLSVDYGPSERALEVCLHIRVS